MARIPLPIDGYRKMKIDSILNHGREPEPVDPPRRVSPRVKNTGSVMEHDMVAISHSTLEEDEERPAAAKSSAGTLTRTPSAEQMILDSSPQREFVCHFSDNCNTGQAMENESRKLVSHHFGRNKSCLRRVSTWLRYCRKHYQRASYEKRSWQLQKCALIQEQLDAILEEFPGARFNIGLKKSEQDRLNKHNADVASNRIPSQDVNAETVAGPDASCKTYMAPLRILTALSTRFCGRNQSSTHVRACVAYLERRLRDDSCSELPVVEFVPEINDTPSPKRKTRAVNSSPGKKGPSRVSKKGAVRKPGRAS